MEIRELRYFLAVAREGNITRAAETLHIAQPSLSKQLMELERKLGKQLLIRGKRKITLTEEGVLLRRRAEEIVELVDKTQHEITSDFEEIVGDIWISCNTSKNILHTASRLRDAHPGVRFHFYSGDADAVSERLDHGTLDFAVMLEPIDNIKYDFLSLPDTSEWGILMLKSDPLASQFPSITKETLLSLPLIMHQRIGLQNEIAHWAEADLEDLTIAATYNVIHGSPIPFVTHGLGYFLTTRDLLDPMLDESVCFLPLSPALPTKTALVWKKHAILGKACEEFKNMLKQALSVSI